MGPKRGADGKLELVFPMADKRLSGIAAEDIGKCAYGILKRGEQAIYQRIGIAGEHLTGGEMATQLAEALDQPITYKAVPPEVYRGFGFPGAEDLGNMFQVYTDFEEEFARARSLEVTRSLNPDVQSFRTWLSRNKDQIPLP